MKKSDLKPGMVVKYRSGDLRVIDDCGWLNYYDASKGRMEKYNHLENYLEDLNSKNSIEDIVAVYKDLRILFDKDVEPLWEEDLLTNLNQDDLVWVRFSDNKWYLRFLKKYNEEEQLVHVYTEGNSSKGTAGYVTVERKDCKIYKPGEVL